MEIAITSRKILLISLIACAFQWGDVRSQADQPVKFLVHLTDSVTGESIPFANVVVYDITGSQIAVAVSSMDGEAQFTLAPAGYKVKAVYVGYWPGERNVDLRGKGRFVKESISLGEAGRIISCCFETCIVDREDYQLPEEEEAMDELSVEGYIAGEETQLREDLNDFICFPNPVKEDLHVAVYGIEAAEMVMLDQNGRLLQKFDLNTQWDFDIDMGSYPPGTYYFVCGGMGKVSGARRVVRVE